MGRLIFLGSLPYGPDKTELGWKETAKMNPGEVIRLIMKFDLPTLPGGYRYRLRSRQARGRVGTSTCGTATSWNTRSTT